MEKFQAKLDNLLQRIRSEAPTKAERQARQVEEEQYQVAKFEEALQATLRSQFGAFFVKEHQPEKTVLKETIDGHVRELFMNRIGAYYSCPKGGGKTHVLLEIFRQIVTLEWQDHRALHACPDPASWIERTCHYQTSRDLCEVIRSRGSLPCSRYHFIDNVGAGDPPAYILEEIESYVESIQRKGCALVLGSRFDHDTMEQKRGYTGFLSRVAKQCQFYQLPPIDLRLTAEVVGDPDWRLPR